LTRIESSQSSIVEASSGARVGVIALLTSPSSRPNWATVPATSCSMSRSSPMSQRMATALPPAARIASTVAWIVPGNSPFDPSIVRAAQTTDAPCAAR